MDILDWRAAAEVVGILIGVLGAGKYRAVLEVARVLLDSIEEYEKRDRRKRKIIYVEPRANAKRVSKELEKIRRKNPGSSS